MGSTDSYPALNATNPMGRSPRGEGQAPTLLANNIDGGDKTLTAYAICL